MNGQYLEYTGITRDLHEYMLAVKPPVEMYSMVEDEVEILKAQYPTREASGIKPYIIIADFHAKEQMEETIIKWIQRICDQHQKFTVTLNNYSGHPPHTIYLRVQNDPFMKFSKELNVIKNYITSCSCPPMHLRKRPQLNIAEVSEKVFYEALSGYAKRSFHGSFEVNELLLMKKEELSGKCKPVNVFGLRPVIHI